MDNLLAKIKAESKIEKVAVDFKITLDDGQRVWVRRYVPRAEAVARGLRKAYCAPYKAL